MVVGQGLVSSIGSAATGASKEFIGELTLESGLLFVFTIVLTFVIGNALGILSTRLLKEKVRPGVHKTISKIVLYGTYAAGFFIAFHNIQFNVPAGLAALGILGIALLLPAVPLMQNLMAGVIIGLERPFKEEDIIEVRGMVCKVKDVMLKSTRLRALDGRIIVVPNIIFISSEPIINYTRGEFIRVSLNVDISASADKDKAIEIIKKICMDDKNILPHVPERHMDKITKIFEIPKNFFTIPRNIKQLMPVVMITGVSKEKTSLEVWFWIWNFAWKERITSSFYSTLLTEFKKEGIELG